MSQDIYNNYDILQKDIMQLDAGVDPKEEEAIFKNVKTFYQFSCNYMLDNLNLTMQEIWKHAEVADIKLKLQQADSVRWSFINYLLDCFPCLLPETSADDLKEQFDIYITEPDLPGDVLDLTQAAEQWTKMSVVTDHNGAFTFILLDKVKLRILLIPLSICACERVFCQVRKHKTDLRGSMDSKTLNALLQLKLSGKDPCFNTSLFSNLKKCKKATAAFLKWRFSNV